MLKFRPGFAATFRDDVEKWWQPEYVEALIAGWRKAGLEIEGSAGPIPPGA